VRDLMAEVKVKFAKLKDENTALRSRRRHIIEEWYGMLGQQIVDLERNLNSAVDSDFPRPTDVAVLCYKAGMKFRYKDTHGKIGDQIFILAKTESVVYNLIGLNDGNCWSNALMCVGDISKTVFDKHFCDAEAAEWLLLTS